MEGVIFGLTGEISGNFNQCLVNTRDDWKAYNDALDKIKSKNPIKKMEGIKQLAELAMNIPSVL